MKVLTVIFIGLTMLTACAKQSEQPVDTPQTQTAGQGGSDILEQPQFVETGAPSTENTGDIRLNADKNAFTAYKDDNEVIFYAEVPADCSPEKVLLIDKQTGETVAELFDEADYEKYGDTIKGDSVYNCRFRVNTDINKNDEVSEQAKYTYYATFTDEKGEHISNPVDIDVFEQFTDNELADMEAVDNAISQLVESEEYNNATIDERREKALALLNKLADEGTPERSCSLIVKESITVSDDTISFSYKSGVLGGVMLKGFDQYMN